MDKMEARSVVAISKAVRVALVAELVAEPLVVRDRAGVVARFCTPLSKRTIITRHAEFALVSRIMTTRKFSMAYAKGNKLCSSVW